MADMHDYYFGQLVQEDELDEGFEYLEQADWDQNKDMGLRGITVPWWQPAVGWPTDDSLVSPTSWTPRENSPTDLQVLIDTGYAYDKDGKRMAIDPPTTVLLDCSEDYLGASTAVTTPGNERWLSIFLRYKKNELDPRTDDNGATVYFLQQESYELRVVMASEQTIGTDTKPPADADMIRLADVYLIYGQTQILDADIYFDRTEYLVDLDVSNWFTPPTPPAWGARILGRNLNEAFWTFWMTFGSLAAGNYIPLAGTSDISGDLDVDTSCSYDLGSSGNYWKEIFVQALTEAMDFTNSGMSEVIPNSDWLTSSGRFMASTIKRWRAATGSYFSELVNSLGRRNLRYMNFREDFLYYNSHAGPFDYQVQTNGTGAVANNPSTFAQILPNGFVELAAPAAADDALVYRDAFPVLADDRNPSMEAGIYVPTAGLTGTTFIYVGLKDGLSTGWAYLLYDPSGVILGGSANGNWWLWFNDGVAASVLTDTGLALATNALIPLTVSFERDPVGLGSKLWFRVYVNLTYYAEVDLTTGGYESNVVAGAWDYRVYLADSVGGSEMLCDYVEMQQDREF